MLIDGYLSRLGFSSRPKVTVETLIELHHRHLDAIPFDNLSIILSQIVGTTCDPVTPELTLSRVAAGGNAGYCFHHNGLVALVLAELGYDVLQRSGQVLGATGPSGILDHLIVEVRGLPTAANPGGRWWPDLGFGDGFRDPLPLVDGTFTQGPMRGQLGRVEEDGWTFHEAPGGSSLGMYVRGEVTQGENDAAHLRLSNPASGGYTRRLIASARDATGVYTVRGIHWIGFDGSERPLRAYVDWRAVLLGLRVSLAGVEEEVLRECHRRQSVGYDDWLPARSLAGRLR